MSDRLGELQDVQCKEVQIAKRRHYNVLGDLAKGMLDLVTTVAKSREIGKGFVQRICLRVCEMLNVERIVF